MLQQLRDETRKEMEPEWDSRLAKGILEKNDIWRKKLRKIAKEMGNKHKQMVKEVEKRYEKRLEEAVLRGEDDDTSTRALREVIEQLKKRLEKVPGLIKAAEKRRRREGKLAGFNILSLNPDLEPSQDRESFDSPMKEKNEELVEVKAARDSWLNDARKFSKEINARIQDKDQEIQRLQALQTQPITPSVELNDVKEELAQTWSQLRKQRGEHYKDWLELGVYEQKVKAQSKEIARLRARRRQVEKQSAEIARIFIRHGDGESSHQEKYAIIAGLREMLDKSNRHQPTQSDQEEPKRLKRRLAKSASKLAESESRLNVALSENSSLRQDQGSIEKALKTARGKLRTARTQASISWSHLEHTRAILDEQNEALAALFLEKSALDTRLRVLEAQLGRANSTPGANRTQLEEAEEKAADLLTANRRVAELEAEKAEIKSQERPWTSLGPQSMPPEFYSDAKPPPTKRLGTNRHKPSPANETRDQQRQEESASDGVFRRVLDIKKAETDEENMFQSLRLPRATAKAILETIKASKRPTIEAPAIIVSELIGVPVEIAKAIVRSMMFRGPAHPAARQLIAAELLLGVPSDVAEKVTGNPGAIVAPLKNRGQGTQTDSLLVQKVVLSKQRGRNQVPWYLERNLWFCITICSLFAVFLAFGFPDSLPDDLIVARTTALARVAQPREEGWWLDDLVEPLQEMISEFREAADWERDW